MFKFGTFSSLSLALLLFDSLVMASRGRRAEAEAESTQSGPAVSRERGRIRRLSELEAGMGPRGGIPREEPHQIDMLTPEMLAMITRSVQAVVQPVV